MKNYTAPELEALKFSAMTDICDASSTGDQTGGNDDDNFHQPANL